jgi:hypothetical protein
MLVTSYSGLRDYIHPCPQPGHALGAVLGRARDHTAACYVSAGCGNDSQVRECSGARPDQ